ncbi:MAG: hypothetical protein J6Y78_01665 [Paludibacteraceae bacterium]|nr:hypothetical protein [Paludibacteraceae bacterium]
MNKEYFKENEKSDYQKLVDFNKKKNLFKDLNQTPEKHYYDASGRTKDGQIAIIELKSRNAILTDENIVSSSTFQSNDLFIEDHKFTDIVLDAISFGYKPLYFNFLEDGHTIIFNLLKLKRRPKRYNRIKIESKGYEKMEFASRQGLDIADSAIYDKDGKLIHKPLISN